MKIISIQGNILDITDVEAIVNPCNMLGLMESGISKEFKDKYPDMYEDYHTFCLNQGFDEFGIHVYDLNSSDNPNFIINIPTKRHWASDDSLDIVKHALESMVDVCYSKNIKSIAIPDLCRDTIGIYKHNLKALLISDFVEECEGLLDKVVFVGL